MPRIFPTASRLSLCGAVLLALTLVAMACTMSGQRAERTLGSNPRRFPGAQPADAATPAARQRLLEMFARAYFPGRTGQLLIVPREGDFITRDDPDVAYMHGSPWAYDVEIPLMFAGPAVKAGVYSMPVGQQDVAPTLAAVTADHGMPSAPPERRQVASAMVDLPHQKFDPQEKQLVTSYEPENAQMFVNEDRLSDLGLTLADLAGFLEAQPFVFAVFTHDEVRRAKPVTPTSSKGMKHAPHGRRAAVGVE